MGGWIGKVVGGAIGFAVGGPVGAAIGAGIGHVMDDSQNSGDPAASRPKPAPAVSQVEGLKIRVAGVTYQNDDGTSRQALIEELHARHGRAPAELNVGFERDSSNPYDANAVKVMSPEGKQLGFLPSGVASQIAPIIDHGTGMYGRVVEIVGNGAGLNYGIQIECALQSANKAGTERGSREADYTRKGESASRLGPMTVTFPIDAVAHRTGGRRTDGQDAYAGSAVACRLAAPSGVCVSQDGVLLVADQDRHQIFGVSPSGEVVVVAGDGTCHEEYYDDGPKARFTYVQSVGDFGGDGGDARLARLNQPVAIACDDHHRVWIADRGNHRLRLVDEQGTISTVYSGHGRVDFEGSRGKRAGFDPVALVFAQGAIVVADAANRRLLRHDFDASTTEELVCRDLPPFTSVVGLAAFDGGGLAMSGTDGFIYWRHPNGVVERLAGIEPRLAEIGSGSGVAYANKVLFQQPQGLASFYDDRMLIIVDQVAHQVFALDLVSGMIKTIAGTRDDTPVGNGRYTDGGFSGDGGAAALAQFKEPTSVAVDSAGALYISDKGNSRVRRIDTNSRKIHTVLAVSA